MSLYVGNLHYDCDEAALFKKFSLIGKIASVKVCRDSETSKSLGYAYVNFSNEEDARKAMDAMSYDLFYGKNIRIMWDQKNPNTLPKAANLVVKNLDPTVSELDLKEMFSPFGNVLSIKVARNSTGCSKGYGFIQFATEDAADSAITSLNDAEMKEKKLSISKFIPALDRMNYQQTVFPNNVYVSNLTNTSTEELFKICESFGEIVSVKVMTDQKNRSKAFGYVSFKEKESADKAILELNRLCLNGKVVCAQYAQHKKIGARKRMRE